MRKHIWYVDAIVTTPMKLQVLAVDEQEAFARANDGAWHGCEQVPRAWDQAKIISIGTITKGPGTNYL